MTHRILPLNKSRAEEVPAIGMKNVYSFKSFSNSEELYFLYFNILYYHMHAVRLTAIMQLPL